MHMLNTLLHPNATTRAVCFEVSKTCSNSAQQAGGVGDGPCVCKCYLSLLHQLYLADQALLLVSGGTRLVMQSCFVCLI